jgi:MFS transporter, ACS family, solute carrier family 17 (sodium-dependent inorganic phosphate cotransporter), other
MMINSVFAFLVPIAAQKFGVVGLCVIRFIQGLGEGPIVSQCEVSPLKKLNFDYL